MSRSIDERIVEMQFNNKQFEAGVSESIRTLENLQKSLRLDGATKGLQDIDTAGKNVNLQSLSDSIDNVSDRFSNLGIVGITILQNITNSAFEAGKQIASALTIDPMIDGFDEYETKMNAIQVIMTNTASKGTTMEDVTRVLDELNEYADLTIYNFSEMTRNIGLFTASGVDLEDSANAIKGISNLAAGVGAGAHDASRAYYQLSQAIASGEVRLQDWRSVENAGMAGEYFQKAIMDSAKTMGVWNDKLQAVEDGTTSFRNALALTAGEQAWFTSDILMDALVKFADDPALVKAATEVKTFTQLMDTMKESMGSGWAQSWEAIIGDKEEAAELFTAISDGFNSIIGPSTNARNEMLDFWNEAGGRTAVIDGLVNIFKGLQSAIKPITEAFREVFPPMTGQRLVEISENFRDLTERFKMGEDTAKNVKDTFKGLFSAIDFAADIFKNLFNILTPGRNLLSEFPGLFFSITGRLGEYITNLNDTVDVSAKFRDVLKKIKEFIKPTSDDVGKLSEMFFKFAKAVTDVMGGLGESIINGINNIDFGKVFDILQGGLFATILFGIKKFIDSLTDVVKESKNILENITGILDGVRGSLEAYQQNIKADTLLKIAGAIGILTASLFVLSTIDSNKIAVSLGAIGVLLAELMGSMAILEKFLGGMGFKSMITLSTTMISLSAAILILSFALKNISDIDLDKMTDGLFSIGILMAELAIFMKVADFEGMGVRVGLGIIGLATGIVILAQAVKMFSSMDSNAMTQGLIGVGLVLAELAIFVNMTGDSKKVISTATGMVILGAAMLIFGKAIENMGQLSLEEIGKGLLAMAGSLTAVTIALNFMPKNMIGLGTGLIAVATGLVIISKAVANMGSMTWDEIARGLVVLAGSLTIISIALNLMKGTTSGSAAILVMAGALAILTPVLKSLGNMSLAEIGSSLLMLAGTFTVIGIAATVLSPAIPLIFSLAASIALLGVGVALIGGGLLGISAGLTALSVSGAAAATSLVVLVSSLIGLIPMFLTQVGEGVIAFATVISDGAPAIVDAIVTVLVALMDAIITTAPKIVETLGVLLTSLLTIVTEHVPLLVEAGMLLVLGLLTGISDNIFEIVAIALTIMINFLDGISSKIPDVIDAGFNLIISFINGTADSLRKNTPLLLDAMSNLINAVIDAGIQVLTGAPRLFMEAGVNAIQGFIDGIASMLRSVRDAVGNIASTALNGLKNVLGIESPSKEFFDAGQDSDRGLINGFLSMTKHVSKAAGAVGKKALTSLQESIGHVSDVIDSDMDFAPTIRPVIDLSDVDNRLNNTFGTKRVLNIDGAVSQVSRVAQNNQNGSDSFKNGNVTTNNQEYVTHNTFNITGDNPKGIADEVSKILQKQVERRETAWGMA